MKQKLVAINSCSECPFFREVGAKVGYNYVCTHNNQVRIIGNSGYGLIGHDTPILGPLAEEEIWINCPLPDTVSTEEN